MSCQRSERDNEKGSGFTMIVAVASPLSPPQHWPIFGHLASSQTVLSSITSISLAFPATQRIGTTHCSFKPLKSFLILLYDAETGIVVFRKEGSRGLRVTIGGQCTPTWPHTAHGGPRPEGTHDFILPIPTNSISPLSATISSGSARKSSRALLSRRS